MIDNRTSAAPVSRTSLSMWVSVIALSLVAALCYFFLDARVFYWLLHRPNEWHKNTWFQALQQFGKTSALVWLLLCWVWASEWRRPALTGLLALLLVVPAVLPLKILVRRPRPEDIVKVHSRAQDRNDLIRSWSFPSGDTANVFAVAAALAPFVGWPWTAILFVAASVIGLMRVLVQAHYPSDVCMGAAAGVFCGWVTLRITRGWLSLESSRLARHRGTVVLAVIFIPVLVGLSNGLGQLLFFSSTCGTLAMGIYVLKLVRMRSDRQAGDRSDHLGQ